MGDYSNRAGARRQYEERFAGVSQSASLEFSALGRALHSNPEPGLP